MVCDWQNVANCEEKCGKNEIFKGCADPSRDFETCHASPTNEISIVPSAKVSKCVCKSGYVLQNGHCIKKSDCGCLTDTGAILPNGHVQLSSDCKIKWECKNSIWTSCDSSTDPKCETCTESEKCQVDQSNPDLGTCTNKDECFCRLSGKGHMQTFDKLFYDFGGDCEYYFSRFTSSRSAPFDVRIRLQNGIAHHLVVEFYPKDELDFLYAEIHFIINKNSITTKYREYDDDFGDFQIKNEFDTPNFQLTNFGHTANLETYFGAKLTVIATSATVELFVPKVYEDSGYGLCGNYNSNKNDDMMTQERQILGNDEVSKFVCGWKYDEDEKCSCEYDNFECTPDSAIETQCREILKGKSENGQWAYCHDWVNPQPFYQNCLTDLCNSNSKSTKCNAFATYTRACMVTQPYSLAYDKLCGISSHFNCDPSCGAGQMFKGCAKPCMDVGTCSNPPVDPAKDMTGFQKCAKDKERISTCVCKPGTLFSAEIGQCVAKHRCDKPETTTPLISPKPTTKPVTYTVSVCKTTTVTKSGYKCARWDSSKFEHIISFISNSISFSDVSFQMHLILGSITILGRNLMWMQGNH